jgi:hypothetical protein
VTTDIYQDGRYAAINTDYHVSDSAWKADHVRRVLQDAGIAPRTMGEIGCGAGEVLRCLAASFPAALLEGWDVSQHAIQLARSREGERVRFYQGDLLSALREPFDVLLCLDVVEHVEDYLGFLRALRARAKWVVLHIPLDLSVQSLVRVTPILRYRENLGHLHYFTRETAIESLKSAGFEVKSWRYTGGSLDLGPRTVLQRIARWPRRAGRSVAPDLTARIFGGFSLMILASGA